jgi:hypothetical protein
MWTIFGISVLVIAWLILHIFILCTPDFADDFDELSGGFGIIDIIAGVVGFVFGIISNSIIIVAGLIVLAVGIGVLFSVNEMEGIIYTFLSYLKDKTNEEKTK